MKRFIFVTVLIIVALTLSSCMTIQQQQPSNQATISAGVKPTVAPAASVSPEVSVSVVTEAPAPSISVATEAPAPSVTPKPSESPVVSGILVPVRTIGPIVTLGPVLPLTTTYTMENVSPKPGQSRDAYITDMVGYTGGQLDITFDLVYWMTGDDAKDQYIADHPGGEDLDAVEESGYIRNYYVQTFNFHTTSHTKYYLPSEDFDSINEQVSFSVFKSKMTTAVENGDQWLSFVKFTLDADGNISKIEHLYTP